MKKTVLSVMLVGLAVIGFAFAQNNSQTETKNVTTKVENDGIQFQNLSLDEAKKLAKETNKLIFIDVYAAWCGPCKMMARGPFTEEKVGNVFNAKFINLKIDAEKDADGPSVARSYSVRAYPTLLFINGDGKLVKNIVGYQSADNLLLHAEMRK